MRRLLFVILITLFTAPALAARDESQTDVSFGKLYLTVFLTDGQGAADRQVLSYFTQSAVLRSISEQVVFHVYTDDSPLVSQTEWRIFLGPKRPAVLLQALPDGHGRAEILYFANSIELMPTAKSLERQLTYVLRAYAERVAPDKPAANVIIRQLIGQCPDDRCPIRPRPRPTPPNRPDRPDVPAPSVEPRPLAPTVRPADTAPPAAPAKGSPWLLYALLPLLGAGAGVWHEMRA